MYSVCHWKGNYMIEMPEKIKSILGSSIGNSDTVGMSEASILLFEDKVLKIQRVCDESKNERDVMLWLKDKLPVPEVICHEIYNGQSYLLMLKLSGVMACDESCLARPQELTEILATGLKMLWDTDISKCPYNFSLDKKLEMARYNVEHELVDTNNVEPDTFGENGFQSPAHLLDWLEHNRPEEDYVFSHGDFCLPNIFIENGKISGFLDLGKTGYADRYQDIALCYRSLKHNYEGKYGGKIYTGFNANSLFDKLELKPDWDKIRYYTLLDELF